MTIETPVTRRQYSDELKAQLLNERDLPGTSVTMVTKSHGINANIASG